MFTLAQVSPLNSIIFFYPCIATYVMFVVSYAAYTCTCVYIHKVTHFSITLVSLEDRGIGKLSKKQ